MVHDTADGGSKSAASAGNHLSEQWEKPASDNSQAEGGSCGGSGVAVAIPVWSVSLQGCQMAKFDPFLSLDYARVEGVGADSKVIQGKEGINFCRVV